MRFSVQRVTWPDGGTVYYVTDRRSPWDVERHEVGIDGSAPSCAREAHITARLLNAKRMSL